jgi:hypothetical protein
LNRKGKLRGDSLSSWREEKINALFDNMFKKTLLK